MTTYALHCTNLTGSYPRTKIGSSHKDSDPISNNMLSCKGYIAAQFERGKAEKKPHRMSSIHYKIKTAEKHFLLCGNKSQLTGIVL